MAEKGGGAATAIGIDYQSWFTTDKLVDLLFEDIELLKAEATFLPKITDEKKVKIENVFIDDLFILAEDKENYFNLKHNTSDHTNWTFLRLKEAKVINQFKDQFKKSPDALLYFVSYASCPIFSKILDKVKYCSSEPEIKQVLDKESYKDFNSLKKEMSFTINEMIAFSKQVFSKQISESEMIQQIKKRLKGKVTSHEFAHNTLNQFARELIKHPRVINRKDLLDDLKQNGIFLKYTDTKEEILKQFRSYSATLEGWSKGFGEIEYLERKEVKELKLWINNSSEKICVLTGNAGTGKTIILKNLLKELIEENIPTLALKCDNQDLELNEQTIKNIISSLDTISEDKPVVIIDQIDALSFSMSRRNPKINQYFSLISQLQKIQNLKIVISCREFDLDYDPVLVNLNKNKIRINNLTEGEVQHVLENLNIKKQQISKELFEILRLPLHLAIFAKVYRKISNLLSVKTFYDLYEELFKQKINSNELSATCEKLSNYMDTHKELVVPEGFLDSFSNERDNLISSGILINENKKFQFFHSSFFDYCFARFYLNKNASLIEAILTGEQDLFTRSQVKSVLFYIRECSNKTYLKELKGFLTNPKIRFHLKHLVIKSLGFEENPTDEEWIIVRNCLDNDEIFRKHFILNIKSIRWLEFFITSGYLSKFLKIEKDYLHIIISNSLAYYINLDTELVSNFLENIIGYEKSTAYILSQLKNWSNEKARNLFYNHTEYFDENHFYFEHLRDIGKYDLSKASDILFEGLINKINSMELGENFNDKFVDHDEVETFEAFIIQSPEIVLPKAIEFFSTLIPKRRMSDDEKYFMDSLFFLYDDSGLYNHWQLFSIFKEKLNTIASENKDFFLELIKDIIDTKSITLLSLVTYCYLNNPQLYTRESFKIIQFFKESIHKLPKVRKLINNVYPYFTEDEKEFLNNLILNLYPEWEDSDNRGVTKYKYLFSIPEQERLKKSNLNKEYSDLKEKFSDFKPDYSDEDVTYDRMQVVGPPLKNTEYEIMDLQQWKATFKIYNESYERIPDSSRRGEVKGGMKQHAEAFTKQVKLKPDFFYDFICEIGNDNEIPPIYFEYGLDGLIEAEYDIDKIKFIIITFNKKKHRYTRNQILKSIGYIDKKENLDLELINILGDYALNDPDPCKDKNSLDGLNTNRGYAVFILGNHAIHTNFSDKLFEIFEEVADDEYLSVRLILTRVIRNMYQFNSVRTFKILEHLLKDKNKTIISESLTLIMHFIRVEEKYFNLLKSYLDEIILTENKRDGAYLGEILLLFQMKEIKGSLSLLKKGIEHNKFIKHGVIRLSSVYLADFYNEYERKKARHFFTAFFNEEDQDLTRKYDYAIENFKPDEFILELLNEYSTSKIFKDSSANYFVEYLGKCVNSYPEQCVKLLTNLMLNDAYIQKHVVSKAVEVLIEAYNKLSDNYYKRESLDILDYVLINSGFTHLISETLEENDRF